MTRQSMRRGLVVAGFLVGLGICEIGLRTIGGVFHDRFTTPDHERGWSLRPGFSGWMSLENTMWVRINSAGLRDVEHALAKSPGTWRLAVLGDSYMQGINVPLEKTFPTFLQSRLKACLQPAGIQAEVLNFGVSGYGTAQELLTYRHHAARYSPDAVMLAIYTNNDIYNNHRRLNPTDYSEQSPYFELRDGALVLDDSFRTVLAESEADLTWWRRLRIAVTNRVRTAQLVYETWGEIRPLILPPPEDAEEVEETPATDTEDLSDAIYRPPVNPEIAEAWRVTEALILQLAGEVKANGSEFWIVTLANQPQINPNRDERAEYAASLGLDSLDYPDRRLREFGAANGIPVIALAEPLGEYSAKNNVHLNGGYNLRAPLGSGHWNEHGNAVAANITGDHLCAAGLGSRAVNRP